MKLFELIGLKNPPEIKRFKNTFVDPKINKQVQTQAARKNPAWKRSLKKAMQQYGFKLIGAGVNGAVFKSPKYPFVLKVYRQDRGFDEWLYFVQLNQGNPFVPKIRGGAVRLNDIFTVIRMEPLVPCAPDKTEAFLNEFYDIFYNLSMKNNPENENPNLISIAKFMRDFEPFMDITHHNIMCRENGEVVIIDPIYIDPDEITDWFDG